MKRRILSILLALMMTLAVLPGTALAAATVASGKCGTNATWSLDSSGTLTIKGSGGMDDNYKSSSGYSSSAPWFSRRGDIVCLVVESGISYISTYAFYDCSNMTSATIKGTATIKQEAFYKCSNLSNLTLPTSLGTIAYGAFYGCDRLKNIYYAGTEEQWNRINISGNSWALFRSGTQIHYAGSPDTASLVSGQCGLNATWSVDRNGTLAIRGFGSMNDTDSIYVPWYYRADSIKKAVIDDDIITIGRCAFYGSKNLISVYIPANIVSIKDNAFTFCENLKHVYYGGTEDQWNEINIASTNNEYLFATTVQFHYNSPGGGDEPVKPSTYTITFNPNGGKVTTTSKQYTANASLGTLPTPTRTGYKFNGWYTAKTGGTKITAAAKATANRTIYAHWVKESASAPKMYLITFNANGGTVYQKYAAVVSGGTYHSLPTPTYPGRHFAGWYTAKTGGVRVTGQTKVNLTANRTLYARWTTSKISALNTLAGKWSVTIPAGDKLPCYASSTTASAAKTQTLTGDTAVSCTKMAMLSNGTIRFYGKISGKNYWFTYSDEMLVK